MKSDKEKRAKKKLFDDESSFTWRELFFIV